MKKAITILLAFVMVLSLAACGGANLSASDEKTTSAENTPSESDNKSAENTSDTVTEQTMIGVWTCERDGGLDAVSNAHTRTLEFYEGGNGYGYDLDQTNGEKYNNGSFMWEINGNIVNVGHNGYAYVINLSTVPYTMSPQSDKSMIFYKESESES